MSPHGDIVDFGLFVLTFAVPMALAYLWGRYMQFREQRRHNKAIEKALDELRAGPAELRLRLCKTIVKRRKGNFNIRPLPKEGR